MAETADPVVMENVKDVVDTVVETVNETLNTTTKTVSSLFVVKSLRCQQAVLSSEPSVLSLKYIILRYS